MFSLLPGSIVPGSADSVFGTVLVTVNIAALNFLAAQTQAAQRAALGLGSAAQSDAGSFLTADADASQLVFHGPGGTRFRYQPDSSGALTPIQIT